MGKGTICCVPGCKSNSKFNRNVSFNKFPKDTKLKNAWIKIISRRGNTCKFSEWQPTIYHRVCGIHFNISGKKTKSDIIPRYMLGKKIQVELQEITTFDELQIVEETVGNVENTFNITFETNVEQLEYSSNFDHTYSTISSDATRQIRSYEQQVVQLQQELKNIQVQNRDLKKQCDKFKNVCGDLTKTNNSLKKTVCKGNILKCLENEQMLKFYTGFASKQLFEHFLNLITPAYKLARDLKRSNRGRNNQLSMSEQLLLVLSRLRLGLLEQDIAYRFKISQAVVSRTYTFWIDFLSSQLSRTLVRSSRDLEAEIFVDAPLECRIQSDNYSQGKSQNSAKGLLGITPNGLVSFVSDLCPRGKNDKDITKESVMLNLIEPSDNFIANTDFSIDDTILKEEEDPLHIPPLFSEESQLTTKQDINTKKVPNARVHIERVIKVIKSYRILKTILSNINQTHLNNTWRVCCYLVNFINEPLPNGK